MALALGPDRVHRILLLGGNEGELRLARARAGCCVAVDLRRTPIASVVGDASMLPLRASSFDVAVAWHVLEHIPQDRAAIQQLVEAVRSEGRLVVSVPIHPRGNDRTIEDPDVPRDERMQRFGDPDHVRSCGLDYGERLSGAGLETTLLAVDDLPHELRTRLGLSAGHVAWIGTRRS